MAKRIISLILLCAAMSFAQNSDQSQSTSPAQQSKKAKDEITVTGCVSRLNSNFILTESHRAHSYQLVESKTLKLGPFMGQEVEVTGIESPTMSTSSPRASAANPVTITVNSIKSIQKRCSAN